jgi:cytochrome c-type biogenesis protein CcmF
MVAVTVGAWALRLAVVASLLALGGWRRPRLGVTSLAVAGAGLGVAVVALGEAFWSNDYSLGYVADHARREVGRATRLSGLWGGMAGSLLLFAFGTAVAALVAAWRAPDPLRGTVAAVGGAVTGALGALVVGFSDPFDRLAIPAVDGAGLTPILEHPAMLYHPPLVYAGLTSLTAAFALTVATMARASLDEGWRIQVRRWLLVPWSLLAVGMVAGSHWAYVELGWGGYWAWDPVENTALLPWLAVTAALHGLRTLGSGRPTALFVGAAFLLALLGGLLTRSGATLSVHAFAADDDIGRALAALLVAATVGFSVLASWYGRRHPARNTPPPVWPPSRDGALRVQQGLVTAALLVVLLGTVWPLTARWRDARPLSVDGTYFATFIGPIAVALLLAMAVGPALGRRSSGSVALPPAVGAAAGVVVAALAGWADLFGLAIAAAGGAAMAGSGAGLVRRRAGDPVGGHLAHLGMALFLVGVAGTTTGATETVSLAVGQTVEVHGHPVTNLGASVVESPDEGTEAVEAAIDVDGRAFRPRLVVHAARNRVLTESALHSTLARDVQVMLRDAGDDGAATLQVGVHPLQQLVWWGALLLVAGGVTAFADRGLSRPGRGRPGGDDAASPTATRATLAEAGLAPRPARPLDAPDETARPAPA